MLKVGDELLCKKSYNSHIKGKYYTTLISDWCSLDSKSYWYVWKYFYTPQELRKMKLKQLMKLGNLN